MSVQQRIRILYIQVPAGGGSLVALYELLRQLPQTIEPVVLCYHRNTYNLLLESCCRVIYLDESLQQPVHRFTKYAAINFMLQQFYTAKDYFKSNRKVRTKIMHILKTEKPAIVHHNNEIFLNRDAIRAAVKAGAKQLVHERSLSNYGNDRVHLFADKRLMKKVYARIDITNAVAQHFNKFYGADSRNIVLHDFVDKAKYKQRYNTSNIRAAYNIAEKEKLVTCIGRIIPWKGQHVLIASVNKIKHTLGSFKVLMVGSAEEGIGSLNYQQQLQAEIEKYKLSGTVIFTGNRNDVPAIIQASDVVVHCSVKPEPQGLVILEALLSNKPVIASATGGSGELVKKYGGIALPVTDADHLAKALTDVLVNGHKPVINTQRLQEDFDPAQQQQVLLSLYEDCLGSKRNKD
ncbi:glycosyltransferase family 4 protein [Panacibacter sp. DH6]|uniref:Glycosyltransferase family 4 protein n=1 Tax=Panacibacter microcysteis TaxID=2793269 RepID=A0A931E8C1_9BACT|nr:glycosyltransferase family 4 protein [Panacibacter microcysteis]MBG9377150.1 glycosyltransferase family 4 protein [Panacibacter microcysteis]